jgi:hypothetical protein
MANPMAFTLFAILIALAASILALVLYRRLKTVAAAHLALEDRFRPVVDIDAERKRVQAEIDQAKRGLDDTLAAHEADLARTAKAAEERLSLAKAEATATIRGLEDLRASLGRDVDGLQGQKLTLVREVASLEEEATLQSFGFYHKHFDFATSDRYETALADIERRQKELVKAGQAAVCTTNWMVEGSEAKGKQFIKRIITLMLRAFNGECDAAIARVKYNNASVMEARIRKAFDAINKLAVAQYSHITHDYLTLRLEELFLTHEHHELLQEEKEEQRRIREQIREEEIAQRELEKARQDAEKEEARYETALAKARADVALAQGEKQERLMSKVAELEAALAEAHSQKERAISRAQLTRSGHVYIISNIGSFGENVYKIGMTRRLDPQERIKELGDASVPFSFDVHAVIYTEDAPGLEATLHQAFADRRINLVNERKEFFHVDIETVTRVVRENHAQVLITKAAEAAEYRKTLALLTERGAARDGWGSYDRRNSQRQVDVPVVA